ncbi:hypothetical protein CDL15_Pgr005645 [Punica granatum]|uniref:DUF7950 domain-containing protein n=1 Tax=Punica granatum TaxID=22663 RepID=A0A218WG69_PUNGR|nr:hypothetical protein CDL15_Pgr005645 [Punica granatum]PKI79090.1 hypothetical protein CRG98_000382 [Punica granatum]
MDGAGSVGRRGMDMDGLGGGAADRSIISPIMLRFRPIAPKPANGEPFSGSFSADGAGAALSRRRVKRRYRVRVRSRKNNIRDGNTGRSDVAVVSGGTGSSAAGGTTTLQLLPGREEDQESAGGGSEGNYCQQLYGDPGEGGALTIGTGAGVGAPDRAAVESRVRVESVGDACMGAAGEDGSLGSTGAEIVRRLELDMCPAFVTDSLNRVRWLNAAYVALVRVEHTWRHGRYSKVVPCDVWRLDWGGFAWRLDVKAALSLGF